MAIELVIGVDIGTGGCKVTALGSDNRIHATSYAPYQSIYPRPGWVEHPPDRWVESAVSALSSVAKSLSSEKRDGVEALVFSAPHHIAVLLDEEGSPIRNAIMWNDQRSRRQVSWLEREYGSRIERVTHNSISTTWTLAHLAWLRENEPESLNSATRITYMKDYVRKAFGDEEYLTDYIECGGTLYWDIRERTWSRELLELIGLEGLPQPEVVAPDTQSGSLKREIAARVGLPSGIPLLVGTADSAAEILAAGGVKPGDAVVKLATAGNLQLVSAGLPSTTKPLTYEHPVDGQFYVNTATNFAAASLRWFRETFLVEQQGGAASFEEMEAAVAEVPAGSGGLIFQPYLNGERSPLWDPRLRGGFFGITPSHTRAHFARSLMEGVAMSIRHAAKDHDEFPGRARLVGGGAKSPVWGQIVADVLGIPIDIPALSDSSAGTALIGARALGWYEDLAQAERATQRILRSHSPGEVAGDLYDELFDCFVDLEKATRQVAHRLSDLTGR